MKMEVIFVEKKTYEEPDFEVVLFETEDILSESSSTEIPEIENITNGGGWVW